MERIRLRFSAAWNKRPGFDGIGKLGNRAFTTLRLNDSYQIGDEVEVSLNDDCLGVAVVEDKKQFLLEHLTPGMSYLDTGYSPEETGAILKRMYPAVDFKTKKITWYLLVYKAEAGV